MQITAKYYLCTVGAILLAMLSVQACSSSDGAAIVPQLEVGAQPWPTGAALTATTATPTTLNLSWPVPAIDPDTTMLSYEVAVDGRVKATVPATQSGLQLTDLAPATTYAVTVRARDAKGQISTPLTASLRTAAATMAIVEYRTLIHNGLTRKYRLDIPASYTGDSSARLVIGLHGGGGTPDGFANYTRLPAAAGTHGWVVAYPEGTAGPYGLRTWNAGGCCGDSVTTGIDDVGFLAALRAEVNARFHLTTTALTGHSNGAIMAYRFACERASDVEGIGVYAGTLFVSPCVPSRPVSLLHIHGLADTNVPLAGGLGSGIAGVTFPPVQAGIDAFRLANGCAESPVTTSVNGVVTYTSVWTCAPNSSVRLITIDDANHEWAGGLDTPLAGTPTIKVNATTEIATFINSLVKPPPPGG